MIIDQIQEEIIDNFNMLDDDIEMSLNYLMELGEGLEPLGDELRIDAVSYTHLTLPTKA